MSAVRTGERGRVSAPRVGATRGAYATPLAAVAAGLCFLTTACQQEMARQPSYRPLEPAEFFKDGRASRPLVEGTVPRGRPSGQSPVLTYLKASSRAGASRAAGLIANPNPSGFAALLVRADAAPGVEDYVDVCPIDIDRAALRRGRERFNVYCAVCHDALGTGNGKIVERGYLPPPNYHTDHSRGFQRRGRKVLLREAPVGYFFEVITRGYGAMPDYSSQVPPDDRWKIVAYVRALQRSQWAPLKDLSEDERDKARRKLEELEVRP